MSLPLFLLVSIALLSFLVILHLQMNIQVSMEETARSMGKAAYLMQQAQNGTEASAEGIDGETISLMSVGINPTTMKAWILSKGDLAGKLNQSRIKGGAGGLYTYESGYDEEQGILDLVAHYDYSVPWLPKSWGTLRMVQRMRSHVWIGESLKDRAGGQDSTDSTTVYVTPTGSVYHTSASCHYLDLSIHSVSCSSLATQRNANGAKYYPCEDCGSAGGEGLVYITDYGTCWHTSLSCSGLKRTVMETDLSEAEGLRPCSKCAGESEHSH